MRLKYRCEYKLHRVLKDMKHYGFLNGFERDQFRDMILQANELAAEGCWDECLAYLDQVEDTYWRFWQERSAYKSAA